MNPSHIEAVNKILTAGQKHCVPVGILVSNPEAANQRIAQGFKFISINRDEGFLRSAASAAFYIVSEEK